MSNVANIKAHPDAPEADNFVHTFDEFPLKAADPSNPPSAETHAAVYNAGGTAYSVNQTDNVQVAVAQPILGSGVPMIPQNDDAKIGVLVLAAGAALYFLFRRKKSK